MKKILFTPILKTKRSSEYNALKELENLLKMNSNINPYIECIKSLSHKDVVKYLKVLESNIFFVEPLEQDIPYFESNISIFKSNCLFCYRASNKTTIKELENFIKINRKYNKSFGIKIDDADERFMRLIETLNENEYLFVELNGTAYSSSSFLESLLTEKLQCKIIIHSNERSQYLKGSDFADYDYNGAKRFNFTIIDAIKGGFFAFDGFGSRCTTKNDNTEEVKRKNPSIFGVFIIYDYSKNEFFSIKSATADYIGRVYHQVKDIISKNKVDIDTRFFNHTLIAKNVLDTYLGTPTFSSSKAITISIVRYIEEVSNNLF